ncbi:MAG TPA: DinB family protein [Longimicrobiaceae bacterium]|nr:DinB family protein [Longimicrobiaceae bacterium]
MIHQMDWTSRTFSFDLPAGVFPAVLERVRGTPARAAALVAGVPEEVLGTRIRGGWSAKEHVGHLDDLHALDERRLGEFLARAEVLTAADMTNRRTEEARHNGTPTARLVEGFRARREALVLRLERLSEQEVEITSMHPRLRRPVRLIDWVYFVAEHDDHHLARAREALRALSAGPGPPG